MIVIKKWKDDLIHIGVFKKDGDGFLGMNPQRMASLLAGGIYQNRDRMDSQYEAVDERLKQVEGETSVGNKLRKLEALLKKMLGEKEYTSLMSTID